MRNMFVLSSVYHLYETFANHFKSTRLFHHQRRQAVTHQALSDLQEFVPFELFVEVVQNEQCEHLSVVPQSFQLQLRDCRLADLSQGGGLARA